MPLKAQNDAYECITYYYLAVGKCLHCSEILISHSVVFGSNPSTIIGAKVQRLAASPCEGELQPVAPCRIGRRCWIGAIHSQGG